MQPVVFAKYSPTEEHTFYGTVHLGSPMLESSYVRAVGSKLKLYTDLKLKLDVADPRSEMSAGYEYHLRVEQGPPNPATGQPDTIPYTTLRGKFNSDGRIIIGLDQLTLGGQAHLKVCASMLHAARDYRFGFGVEVHH